MAAPKAPASFIRKIVSAVRRDPQKAGILTVLIAILLVLQVRLFMSDKDMSAHATVAGADESGPMTTPSQAPRSAKANKGGSATAGAARPMDSATALRAWMDAPPLSIGRNLFAADLERFPQDNGKSASANTNVTGFWDELAKSMTLRADVKKERQILVENLTQQASQLRLQSTMMGAVPKAVINGDMVREGDVVACGSGDTRFVFRMLKIEARRILVECEGIKLEVEMK